MAVFLAYGRRAFASLSIRNYRLYFIGQSISLSGTWMQNVALGWLVLLLTHSGVHLGIITAMEFIPILVLGAWGGVIVDRFSNLRILFLTQTAFFVMVSVLTLLIFTDMIEIWMLYIFAPLYGLIRVFDTPARQSFVSELVGNDQLKNAISLNSTANNSARTIGPTIAGIIIAATNIGFCFLVNAGTYLVVLYLLYEIRIEELHSIRQAPRRRGQLMEGLRYVWSHKIIRGVLLMMALIGTFAYEFPVSLPLVAQKSFGADAAGYAALLTAMGVGAIAGGLYAAGRSTSAPKDLIFFTFLFGASIVLAALMPTLLFATFAMVLVGVFSINVIAIGNTTVQLNSAPEMRGRVMALWSVAMIGSTTIGGPIIGWISELLGARWGLGLGGACAMVTALLAWRILRRQVRITVPDVVLDMESSASAQVL